MFLVLFSQDSQKEPLDDKIEKIEEYMLKVQKSTLFYYIKQISMNASAKIKQPKEENYSILSQPQNLPPCWPLRLAFMQSVAPYLISPARIPSFASTSVHSSHRNWSLCVWCIFLFSAKTMGVLGGGPTIDWNSLTEPSDSPPDTPHRDQRAAVDLQQEWFPSRFHHCVVRAAGVQL